MKKLFLLTISILLAFPLFAQTPGKEIFKTYAGDVSYNMYNMSPSALARAGFLAVNDTTDTLYIYVGDTMTWFISNRVINIQNKLYIDSAIGSISFDDGVSDSPITYWIDADDSTFSIQKLDAGNTQFVSNEGDFIFNPAGGNIIIEGTVSIIHDSLIVKRECSNIVDDGTITLPDATTQSLLIWVDGDNEWAQCAIQADGTVTILTSVGSVVNTDTDTNLCIYDSGTGATIGQRLGSSKVVCYETKYKQ